MFLFFQDFIEVYDRKADPNELKNLVSTMDASSLSYFKSTLNHLAACAGPQCLSIPQSNATYYFDPLKGLIIG